MRIAFFGGSFDPPHNGHLAIARAAAEHFAIERVLLAPTGLQPFKHAGAEAAYTDRLEMVRQLCAADPALLEASILDAPRADGMPNYTVDALTALLREQPAAELFAIVGADALPDLPHWHDPGRLFELAQWIAVSRPGHPVAEPLPEPLQTERARGRLHLLAGVSVPLSSRELRARLHRGEACDTALPPTVADYIASHALYRAR